MTAITEGPEAAASGAARAVVALALEVLRTGFRLRSVGQSRGLVTGWGDGNWGLMHSLTTEGPQTVPQIARARPVARQHIQKLANELARDGLVDFIENPAHRRSRLVRLTPKGKTEYQRLSGQLMELAAEVADTLDEDELRAATHVLAEFREKLEAL
ncbi:MAG TPA: MarR family transcriptional regulator [Alphaproteobacteria bacterium]|jgi:DNA-binding MarR family transcriptional regulator|nr:MarR family transcriptional regulator [Alphaproteobacteria bacterium]